MYKKKRVLCFIWRFNSMRLLLWIFGLSICPITCIWSIDYYQGADSCRDSKEKERTTAPKSPYRFLSDKKQSQGSTGTCSFHAGAVVLEALINLQQPSPEPVGISVVDAMEQLGHCSKKQIESAKTSPVKFLLDMRKKSSVRPYEKSVEQHYGELCTNEIHKISQPIPQNTVDNFLQLEGKVSELGQSNIPIPKYNIETWDLKEDDKPEKISEDLISYFNQEGALPLAFTTCMEDDKRSGVCLKPHAITLVGVRKVICSDGKFFYTGIFKNSWDRAVKMLNLTTVLNGMIKYKMGYSTVRPCKDAECLDPPILDTMKSTRLYHLADAGDLDGIKKIFKSGEDVNVPGSYGRTPLYCATSARNIEVARYLLTQGADLNIAASNGFTPLRDAALSGDLEGVRFLVENKADINKADSNGRTPLLNAVYSGNVEVVKYLLEKGADPNMLDNAGWTPLHYATAAGHLDIVTLLLENKAEINQADGQGITPLFKAMSASPEVLKYLLEHKADPNMQSNGWTPLNSAVAVGRLDIVTLLLDNKADINKADASGMTPLHYARNGGRQDIEKYLLDHGAKDGPP
ncbi:MAG: ankyrin repeat domain-containing protein [Oligoflexia bacterium]|nr:ankyrin repeat domain-containing protein [Oligoflexia bacterium]